MGYEIDRKDTEQLLHEAGCGESFVHTFLRAMDEGSLEAQLRLLRDQRRRQLDLVHMEAKKLDRLDYLRYTLEKQLSARAKSKGDGPGISSVDAKRKFNP